MNNVHDFVVNHPEIITFPMYAGGMYLIGKGPAVISLPTTLLLAIYDKVRHTPSSSPQRIFAERCAIVVASTMICKLFLHLYPLSSPYNISFGKTVVCSAYGIGVCVVHFFVTKEKECLRRMWHDCQRCPIMCLIWPIEKWKHHIEQGRPYDEAVGMFLIKNSTKDFLEELKKDFPMPKSHEEWDKYTTNQILWLRLLYTEEIQKDYEENNLQDSILYYLAPKHGTCGLIDLHWLTDICENLTQERYDEMKDDPVLKSIFKRLFLRLGGVLFQEEQGMNGEGFLELYQELYQLDQSEKMPLPPWAQSPKDVDVKTFYDDMTHLEKSLYLKMLSEQKENWSQMSCGLRSAIVSFTIGSTFNDFTFKHIKTNPKSLKGVRVPCLENLSMSDLEKILKRIPKSKMMERHMVANQIKVLAEQNPDLPLAQDSERMQLVKKYASQESKMKEHERENTRTQEAYAGKHEEEEAVPSFSSAERDRDMESQSLSTQEKTYWMSQARTPEEMAYVLSMGGY